MSPQRPPSPTDRLIDRDCVVRLPTSLSPEASAWLTPPPERDQRSPFSGDIRVGKNSATYRAHSYHTKVPAEAIRPLVEHYCRPGGLVLDSFCGSGMTGVAAILSGRNAVLSDLSPAAVHIARNYTTPCDPRAFSEGLADVRRRVTETMEWLYSLPDNESIVEYTVWSDEFECPGCSARLVYWEAARSSTGSLGDVRCQQCGASHSKRELRWVGERPVETNTSARKRRSSRSSHSPTPDELELLDRAVAVENPYWVPSEPFGPEREMWRAAHRSLGIECVADFYTPRNLLALAALREAICRVGDERVRDALLFAFTAIVNRASKRYQWNAKRPTNVMTGTLYVSSLRYEWNVWSLFERKARDVLRYYRFLGSPRGRCETVHKSATALDHLPDGVVDFAFIDPPFGSNIFYGDSSLLWEAWLGRVTPLDDEIVVNKKKGPDCGGKTLEDYSGLMGRALAEVGRVLRPGAFAVLQFNNTDGAVWTALQDAISAAGFEVASTSQLDKVHPSIKGVKGLQGREKVASLDTLISLRRAASRKNTRANTSSAEALRHRIASVISEVLAEEQGEDLLRIDRLHGTVVRHLLENQTSITGVSFDLVREVYEELRMKKGEAVEVQSPRREPQAGLLQGYLGDPGAVCADSAQIPTKHVDKPEFESVGGSRNTAFYNAHSYHTKVPPEAIQPFLEHFTRPGDLVLDPFSGSGMTGLAALLSGRRAIINDLSVAAAHLGFNHTRPCSVDGLSEAGAELYERLRPRFEEIYKTEAHGAKAYVHYTIWSPRYACPACDGVFSMWSVVDHETGRVGRDLTCPSCGVARSRRSYKLVDQQPAFVNYEVPGGSRREGREVTDEDLEFIRAIRREDIKGWYPTEAVHPDREMYIRCALQRQSIKTVADFYTPRNLLALSILWEEIQRLSDARLRQALSFAFTNTAWHGTRMRRFNARGGQRPLTGTLYIPQLSVEVNVLEVFRRKISQLASYYRALPAEGADLPVVRLGSAADLHDIPSGSVDYVFTDPPFGSNIFYADCNLIWEAWLGQTTVAEHEMVVNRSLKPANGGKTVSDYQQLMHEAFAEMHRVLKPNAWATLVFHNTDAEVWRAIQEAAIGAGFQIEQAAELDRKQQSHKGYKGRSGQERVAHFDVVFSMKKASASVRPRRRRRVPEHVIKATIRQSFERLPVEEHTVQRAHSSVLRGLANEGFDLGSVTFDRIRELVYALQQGGSA